MIGTVYLENLSTVICTCTFHCSVHKTRILFKGIVQLRSRINPFVSKGLFELDEYCRLCLINLRINLPAYLWWYPQRCTNCHQCALLHVHASVSLSVVCAISQTGQLLSVIIPPTCTAVLHSHMHITNGYGTCAITLLELLNAEPPSALVLYTTSNSVLLALV